MRILYKPKMLATECARCGCIFVPKRKHLQSPEGSKIKDGVACPICNTLNCANFERKSKGKAEVADED